MNSKSKKIEVNNYNFKINSSLLTGREMGTEFLKFLVNWFSNIKSLIGILISKIIL